MKETAVFFKKEFLESLRSYRLILLLAVFAIFGIMNPLTAKFIPQLLSMAMPEGVTVTLADPTAYDSWTQFYKNITQMGSIVMLIVCSGILSTEISKGTLINILAKGISRTSVLLAKFFFVTSAWTVALGVSYLITWGYTLYYFPWDSPAHLVFAVLCLWLFGILLLCVLMLASALTRSALQNLLCLGAFVMLLMLLGIIPALSPYNPIQLASGNMSLLTRAAEPGDFLKPILVSVGLGGASLTGSILLFRKKQL